MGNVKRIRENGPGHDPGTLPAAEKDAGQERHGVPPALREALHGGETAADAERVREAMTAAGWCPAAAPAVTLELSGSLRLDSGCELLALRAGTLGEAAGLLLRAYPALARLIPDEAILRQHYRFSLNGKRITSDPAEPLRDGDHVLIFSASVGG